MGLCGNRTVSCEVLGDKCGSESDGKYDVAVLEQTLAPGDVYVTSPACCYHSVRYESQAQEEAQQPPNTLVVHLRSDLMRLRHGQRVFHRSNKFMADVVAPV